MGEIHRCIYSFIILIKQLSAASEPVNMRMASANSMIASLSEVANIYAHGVLDLWFTCTSLLEDEDLGLRERLAESVQRCFTSTESGSRHEIAEFPTQVEKVIELSLEFLFSIFSHWIVYFEYLMRCVIETTSSMVARGDLVRQVFDKEIDNHYEEKLTICQICCFYLEKLPVSLPSENKQEDVILRKWRTKFYDELIKFAGHYLQIESRVDWIGGPGNHKDVFTSLYANLLGFYALSRCLFKRQTLINMPQLSDVVELERVIKPFLENPLISNLYLLVVQLHEDVLVIGTSLVDQEMQALVANWLESQKEDENDSGVSAKTKRARGGRQA
ncbi:hypothetical protein GIB67_013522 [Kingdonia uniflora]|uniref:Uncharacterized protein n=1 Tax=Kingdonia uniflora TaxID=39325 RepID=A0A7J7KUU9_9MAGN|nr:hypothetical protein GIB67_013522 [Kingdonia uniflora]